MALTFDNAFQFLDGLAGKAVDYKQAEAQAEMASADQWRTLAERSVENSPTGQQSGEQPEAKNVWLGPAIAVGVVAVVLVGARLLR